MNERAWRVRAMHARDIAAVLSIQEASPEAARWTAADYERAVAQENCASVAEGQHGVVGFAVVRVISDELEILNMAVQPAARRQGFASLLLANVMELGRVSGAKHAFLEVRQSNSGAVAFYARHGFAVRGRRPRYYNDPVEDALILSRALD